MSSTRPAEHRHWFFWGFYGVQMAALALTALLIRVEANKFWDLYLLILAMFGLLNIPCWIAAPYILRVRQVAVRALLGGLLCSPFPITLTVAIVDDLIHHGWIRIIPPIGFMDWIYIIPPIPILISWAYLTATRYERVSSSADKETAPHKPGLQVGVASLLVIQAIAGCLLLTAVYGGAFYFVTNLVLLLVFGIQRVWFRFATRNWVPYPAVDPRDRFRETPEPSFDSDFEVGHSSQKPIVESQRSIVAE